jgi:hypothetical protein
MTTVVLTIAVLVLLAGWYFVPTLLVDTVAWCKDSAVKAVDYFRN